IRSAASMQGMCRPLVPPTEATMSFSFWAVRKLLKACCVSRTWATLSRRSPVYLKGVPSGFLVRKAPPQEFPQPPPLPPEHPTAISAAARASRARLRRGRDSSVDSIRVQPPAEMGGVGEVPTSYRHSPMRRKPSSDRYGDDRWLTAAAEPGRPPRSADRNGTV